MPNQPSQDVLNHAGSLAVKAEEARNIDNFENDNSTNSIVTVVSPVMIGVHHEADGVLDAGIQNFIRLISSPGLNSTQEETSPLTKLRSTKVKALLTLNSGSF